ncbi:hypothetical protein C8Q76DRAFT_792816 [Earliella scabrosa]|nr:hypothetical protein C8Q76DRAFT_792816 [Earliella scabrosa]
MRQQNVDTTSEEDDLAQLAADLSLDASGTLGDPLVGLQSPMISPRTSHPDAHPPPPYMRRAPAAAAAAVASGLTININVHAGTVPVTINMPAAQPDDRARSSQSSAGSRPRHDSTVVINAAPGNTNRWVAPPMDEGSPGPARTTSPQQPTPSAPPPFIMRGGGKVIPWDSRLEHLERDDPAHTGKWYVVIAGLRVGIWRSWLDMEGFVDVKGSRYQFFPTFALADHHYKLARREGRVRLLTK